MADIVGLDGLHNIEGYKCDLCGGDCDPKAQELKRSGLHIRELPKDRLPIPSGSAWRSTSKASSLRSEEPLLLFHNCKSDDACSKPRKVPELRAFSDESLQWGFAGIARQASNALGAAGKGPSMITHVLER